MSTQSVWEISGKIGFSNLFIHISVRIACLFWMYLLLSLCLCLQCSDVGLISRIVESHSHQVLSKLNSQREAGLFCDITLKTGGGQSFVAHKAVLAAVSEYFQELFTEMDSATDLQSHVDLTGMVQYIFKINQFQNQCLFTLVSI